MRRMISAIVIMVSFSLGAAFPVAENGKAKCVIVHPDRIEAWNRGRYPNLMVLELKKYLEKMTGAVFEIYPESKAPKDTPAIFAGNTRAAREAGIDISKLGKREWRIKSDDNRVILAGGSVTGSMYALYVFLEKKFGVLYLSPEAERIPFFRKLSLERTELGGKPAFESNYNYHGYFRASTGTAGKKLVELYELKHRSAEAYEDMGYDRKVSVKTGHCHSFFRYVPPKKYFREHPEYYSMNKDGKRACLPSGQLCLTNPDVKKIVIRQLLEWIQADKAENPGNHALVYDFSQEDNTSYICLCNTCRAVTEKHGGEAGLILEFVNDMARAVRAEHPEIMIKTFAYVSTENPVRTIRPEKNVIVWLCDLYSKSNRMKPLTDSENKERLKLLADWMKQTDQISLWDYWNMGAGDQPEVLIDAIAADTRLFHRLGLKYLFNECEIGTKSCNLRPQSFIWLQYYVSYKLQENPALPLEPVVTEFMDAYYGEAAPRMKEYLALLRSTVKENTPTFMQIQNRHFPYVTSGFLAKSRDIVLGALRAAESPDIAQRVRNELNVIDYAFIKILGRETVPGVTRDAVIAEYRDNMLSYVNATALLADGRHRDAAKKEVMDEIETFNLKFDDLPPQFAGVAAEDIKLFAHPHFPFSYQDARRVKDPESSMPLSLAYLPVDQSKHKVPWVMGLYEPTAKKAKTKRLYDIPQDEKYHWILIDRFKIGPMTRIWAPGSWHMGIQLKDAFTIADGIEEANNPNYFDVWVSIRFQGPAYVKGSAKENAVYIDRAALIRRRK